MKLLCMMDVSDWISIITLIVNSGLAIWIVSTIQKKRNDRRVLKDYFINELLDIRNSYKNKLEKIHGSKTKPKELLPWFKLMNVKVINLMELVNEKYGIDEKRLDPFQNKLRHIITEDEGFINSFKPNNYIELTEDTKSEVYKFLQENTYLFNELIVEVNDS